MRALFCLPAFRCRSLGRISLCEFESRQEQVATIEISALLFLQGFGPESLRPLQQREVWLETVLGAQVRFGEAAISEDLLQRVRLGLARSFEPLAGVDRFVDYLPG